MKRYIISLFMLFGVAHAHEMTPTYPTLTQSHLDGVYKTTMEMFNKRGDVKYYEIGVFDSEWKPIPFVTAYNLIKLEYLQRVTFDVYIREADKDRATYVCSRSKLQMEDTTKTSVSSKICSKFK